MTLLVGVGADEGTKGGVLSVSREENAILAVDFAINRKRTAQHAPVVLMELVCLPVMTRFVGRHVIVLHEVHQQMTHRIERATTTTKNISVHQLCIRERFSSANRRNGTNMFRRLFFKVIFSRVYCMVREIFRVIFRVISQGQNRKMTRTAHETTLHFPPPHDRRERLPRHGYTRRRQEVGMPPVKLRGAGDSPA